MIDFPGWNSMLFTTGMSSNCEIAGVRGVEDAQPTTIARTHSTRATRAVSTERVFSMAGSYQSPWRKAKQFVALTLVLALVLPGCASRNVPPVGAAGKTIKPESDERKLWSQADKEEEKIAKQSRVWDDPLMEEYLARIGDRLMPAEVKAAGGPGLRVRVIRDPTLNAFAMPNGAVYIHTGLLARLDNEAQLATILGHEMTHMDHRHALKFSRDAQNKTILFDVTAI